MENNGEVIVEGPMNETKHLHNGKAEIEIPVSAIAELKRFVDILATANNEARINFEQEKIWAKLVDLSNIMLVSAELRTSIFSKYDLDSVKQIGVELSILKSIIKGSDPIELRIERNSLIVKKPGMSLTTQLFDPESLRKEPNLKITWETEVEVDTQKFKSAIAALKIIAPESISLFTTNGEFYISGGNETSTMTFELGNIGLSTDVKCLFSYEYIAKIAQVLPDESKIVMGLNKNYPLRIRTEGAEFILAPRIEDGS